MISFFLFCFFWTMAWVLCYPFKMALMQLERSFSFHMNLFKQRSNKGQKVKKNITCTRWNQHASLHMNYNNFPNKPYHFHFQVSSRVAFTYQTKDFKITKNDSAEKGHTSKWLRSLLISVCLDKHLASLSKEIRIEISTSARCI